MEAEYNTRLYEVADAAGTIPTVVETGIGPVAMVLRPKGQKRPLSWKPWRKTTADRAKVAGGAYYVSPTHEWHPGSAERPVGYLANYQPDGEIGASDIYNHIGGLIFQSFAAAKVACERHWQERT